MEWESNLLETATGTTSVCPDALLVHVELIYRQSAFLAIWIVETTNLAKQIERSKESGNDKKTTPKWLGGLDCRVNY